MTLFIIDVRVRTNCLAYCCLLVQRSKVISAGIGATANSSRATEDNFRHRECNELHCVARYTASVRSNRLNGDCSCAQPLTKPTCCCGASRYRVAQRHRCKVGKFSSFERCIIFLKPAHCLTVVPRNVLVGDSLKQCKLADFGMGRDIGTSEYYKKERCVRISGLVGDLRHFRFLDPVIRNWNMAGHLSHSKLRLY